MIWLVNVRKCIHGTIIKNNRSVIWPLELDIWFPEINVAIEYDGDYWHSLPRMIRRDERKNKLCKEKNINLIRVKESEYISNKEIILKNINEILNKGNKNNA